WVRSSLPPGGTALRPVGNLTMSSLCGGSAGTVSSRMECPVHETCIVPDAFGFQPAAVLTGSPWLSNQKASSDRIASPLGRGRTRFVAGSTDIHRLVLSLWNHSSPVAVFHSGCESFEMRAAKSDVSGAERLVNS